MSVTKELVNGKIIVKVNPDELTDNGISLDDIRYIVSRKDFPSHIKEVRDLINEMKAKGEAIDELVFCEGISFIGRSCFSDIDNIYKVVLPRTVTMIEKHAFYLSSSIREITIPPSLAILEEMAFAGTGIKSAVIPGAIERIPIKTFHFCTSLEQVVIEEGITRISDSAFEHCEVLKEVKFPTTLKRIDMRAFSRCMGLREVEINSDLEHIFVGAFSYCIKLKRFILNGMIDFLPMDTFLGCHSLEEVRLGLSGTFSLYGVFKGLNNLKKIDLTFLNKDIEEEMLYFIMDDIYKFLGNGNFELAIYLLKYFNSEKILRELFDYVADYSDFSIYVIDKINQISNGEIQIDNFDDI